MEQPEGYVKKGKEDKVCLLKKSLYGLKQSPREWNHRFDAFIISQKYKRSVYDLCVYSKGSDLGNMAYLLLYIDDMLIASKGKKIVEKLKEVLSAEFEMKDLGPTKRILGGHNQRQEEGYIGIISSRLSKLGFGNIWYGRLQNSSDSYGFPI